MNRPDEVVRHGQPSTPPTATANDRLKRSFGTWFWGSMIVATLIHSAVLAAWPAIEIEPVEFRMTEIEAIDLPPEIRIPPPPEQIARPANPVVVATADISADVTISPTSFEWNRIDDLPPPPREVEIDISSQPTFTPFTVAPEVRNRGAVGDALRREYPAVLRDNGIGGRVVLHFFIDASGSLENVLVAEGSGFAQLDAAALRVAEVFEFTPAMNRDERVPVWIQVPIAFQSN